MEIHEISQIHQNIAPQCKRVGSYLQDLFVSDTTEREIGILDITNRVKTLDSFLEKIERKQVSDPWMEIQDIIGVRIVCFTLTDVDEVEAIIRKKFKVFQAVVKSDTFEFDKFGYRSSHYNIVITKEITDQIDAPDLVGKIAEIQVRTILMHTWSKIHRKLEYKKQEHIPFSLRRKLSQLSALLEIADEHLEDLFYAKEQLKQQLKVNTLREAKNIGVDTSLNLDSLIAFIEFHFPNKRINNKGVHKLLDELLNLNISLELMIKAFDRIEPIRPLILERALKNKYSTVKTFKFALMCGNDNYWDYKKKNSAKNVYTVVQKMRIKLIEQE